MRATAGSIHRTMSSFFAAHRLILACALLALAGMAAGVEPADAGGPSITAAYSLRDGQVHVTGRGFRAGARIEIVVTDLSRLEGPAPSDTVRVTANKQGRFTATTNERPAFCPNGDVRVVADDRDSRDRATLTFPDFQCPW